MTSFFRSATRCFLIALGATSCFFSAHAQVGLEAEPLEHFTTDAGKCTLVNGVQHESKLRFELETTNLLKLGFRTHIVVWEQGEKNHLYAGEVKTFTIFNRVFISTNMAGQAPVVADSGDFEGFFVQLADSGKLQLARRYMIAANTGGMGGSRIWNEWLIRRRNGAWTEIPRPAMGGYSSKKFRQALQAFLADRPDLLDSLNREALTYRDVAQAIRAYNSGETTFFVE